MTKKTNAEAAPVVEAESRIEFGVTTYNKENTMKNTELTAKESALINAVAAELNPIETTVTSVAQSNVVAGFDLNADEAKFVIQDNRVSLMPGNCTRVEIIRDYFSCKSALTAFLDLYHQQKYRIVTPSLFVYSWIDGLSQFTSGKIGYVSSDYRNDADAVMFPDGTISELRFNRLPKVGWAELWNYTGMVGIDHKELVADSQFEANRDQYRKCSFIRNFASGCGYVFTFGPSFAPYVAQLFKTWNMPAEEARKEQSQRVQAKQEQKRVYQISKNMEIDLRKSEKTIEDTDLVVKAYPDGSELYLSGTLPGTIFQLYDLNGVKKYRVYWTEDVIHNVVQVQSAASGWLWEKVAVTTPEAV